MRMEDLRERFPQAEIIEMNELIPAAEVGKGPWRLYIFRPDGYHEGGQWFRLGKLKYPNEEITFSRAKQFTESAIGKGLEVRICDGGDNLVFRSECGKITYGSTFWNEANPDPAVGKVADRLKGNMARGTSAPGRK